MRPHLFLDLADELVAVGSPAKCRSTISRAYYAVYNVAEQFLSRMNFVKPRQNYHVILQHRLRASGDAEFVQIGSDLGDFHQERIDADYRMDLLDPESQANAQAAAIKARTMIEAFDNVPINGTRWKQIQASICRVNVTGIDHLACLPAVTPSP